MAQRMISGVVEKPDILKITRSGNYDSLYNFISLNSDGRSKAWLNFTDEFGLTALHIATINNDMRCLKLLIDCQSKKEAEDNDGRTPLHFAAIHGYYDILMLLIDEPATLRSVPDHNGCTPLHEAARNGHYECVVSLVIPNPLVPDRGALRNAETTYGVTPLMLAAFGGHTKIVEFLVGELADVDFKTSEYKKASDFAKTEELKLYLMGLEKEVKGFDKWCPCCCCCTISFCCCPCIQVFRCFRYFYRKFIAFFKWILSFCGIKFKEVEIILENDQKSIDTEKKIVKSDVNLV